MRLNGLVTVAGLAVLSSAGLVGTAQAADMPLYDAPMAPYAEPQQSLEFGTGWYLRGDGAYAEEDHPKFDATRATFDRNAQASGYAFGVGAGYKLNTFLRFDVTADYLDAFDYAGHANCGSGCTVAATDHVWRWDGLVNAYVDLGTWYGMTPYLGAGAGVGATRQDAQQTTTVPNMPLVVQKPTSNTDYQFAWAGMAGVSYAFSPHAMIDVGYRYLDLGPATFQLRPVASAQKDVTEQQVRVGVRYMVD